MTSASELFYQRRSRIGRNSDSFGVGSDFGSPPPPAWTNRRHRHNNSRRDRLDSDGCNPLRRNSSRPRQAWLHRSSHPTQDQDRETVWLEEGSHQSSAGNAIHPETQSNARDRLRLRGNDRLPGAVLLARERLLQRLRGVTLSSSRRSNRNSSSNQRSDIANAIDFSLVDAGDWETETPTDWVAVSASTTYQHPNKRPPGLTEEVLNSLPVEIFCITDESNKHHVSRASRDCSICLESFSVGNELMRLPCGHRYHLCCLDPWVRICGDCPYCRRSIEVTILDRHENNQES